MRVLLDESVPRQLGDHLGEHEVTTVPRMGWAGLSNGELLRRASEAFDVLVTGDQGLQHQQNVSALRLGIVVIAAQDNRVETIVSLSTRILAAIDAVGPGSLIKVVG